MITKLHFVYNETSNPLSLALSFAHRIHSPETYQCRLCHITYGTFFIKKDWENFIQSLPFPAKFHLKDWFVKRFPAFKGTHFPAAFSEDETGNLHQLIFAEEFNQMHHLDELKKLLHQKLAS